jgi:hypothetical protein
MGTWVSTQTRMGMPAPSPPKPQQRGTRVASTRSHRQPANVRSAGAKKSTETVPLPTEDASAYDGAGLSRWDSIDPREAAAYRTNVVEGCVEQLKQILEEAGREIPEAQRRRDRWTVTHYALGVPAAVLAAMAAATGLASTAGRVPAAIIALTAAGISAVAAFLNGTKRAQECARAAADWENLRDLMSVCLATDVPAVKAWKRIEDVSWLKYRVDGYIAAKAALRRGEPLSSVKGVFQDTTLAGSFRQ